MKQIEQKQNKKGESERTKQKDREKRTEGTTK